jgi:hypothetical protein
LSAASGPISTIAPFAERCSSTRPARGSSDDSGRIRSSLRGLGGGLHRRLRAVYAVGRAWSRFMASTSRDVGEEGGYTQSGLVSSDSCSSSSGSG